MSKRFLKIFTVFSVGYLLIIVFTFLINAGAVDVCGNKIWKIIMWTIMGVVAVSWVWGVVNRLRRKDFRTVFAWAVILFLAIIMFSVSVNPPRSYSYRDGRRISDVRQIELGLELYYSANAEYPTSLQVLVEDGYLNMPEAPSDPEIDKPYDYSYGIDKDTGKIEFYHVGAILKNINSDSFARDADYNSTEDTPQVNWRADSKNPGPCLTANGFNGADDNSCGLSGRAGVYDRGVFPE